ncbi:MAG: sigma-70 family RNA polymerase sigma factor [Gemmatimonadaceae bacterium]|nr:sigma-70 family RNA polymerase sigma factor [Gemmatimonadaceae bacterium]
MAESAPIPAPDFRETALPFLPDVYRFARSLTRDAADADDVVQETFLRALRSWRTFIPGSDCRRWLFTICRNVYLRSRERAERQVALDDGDDEAIAAVQAHAGWVRDGTDVLLARLDLGPAISAALDELSEPFRSAVVLVDLEDHSYEEAAAILEVPVGTVRSRLFRARRLLQERLARFAQDAGFTTSPAGGMR